MTELTERMRKEKECDGRGRLEFGENLLRTVIEKGTTGGLLKKLQRRTRREEGRLEGPERKKGTKLRDWRMDGEKRDAEDGEVERTRWEIYADGER
ncbi:hypothetical protein Tco_1454040 [Tanacetum coccineum]